MNRAHPRAPAINHASLPRLLLLLTVLAGAAALTACRTTEGFGKDVKTLGKNVEDSAARNK